MKTSFEIEILICKSNSGYKFMDAFEESGKLWKDIWKNIFIIIIEAERSIDSTLRWWSMLIHADVTNTLVRYSIQSQHQIMSNSVENTNLASTTSRFISSGNYFNVPINSLLKTFNNSKDNSYFFNLNYSRNKFSVKLQLYYICRLFLKDF